MPDWLKLTQEMERLLRLKTYPVAYKRLEKAEELEKIPSLRRFDREFSARNQYCQIPTIVRKGGLTIGVLRGDIHERCARINGLAATTEEQKEREAVSFSTSWFANVHNKENIKDSADHPV